MQNVFQVKSIKGLLALIFLCCVGISDVFGQGVLLAGTSFDPKPGNESRQYIGVLDIVQYGLQTGALSIGAPLTPSANANVFNGTYQYAITNNPVKLDAARYNNIATPDYQLVLSPATATSNMLEYTLQGVAPNTPVTVNVTYCSVISPTYATCGPGEITSFRGVINPDQYNTMNGIESAQVKMGACSTFTFNQTSSNSQVVGADGSVTVRLNTQQTGQCKAVAISKIEIFGTPKPAILSAQGNEVCAGEQITLQAKQSYDATYQWQVDDGTGWKNIAGGTNVSQLYEVTAVKDYKFRLQITPTSGGSAITSDPITVKAITCCTINGAPASRQTIYYDDFGRVDLSDETGSTYTVWDYSDPLNPKEVTKTTTTPFRWPITPSPLGATFVGTGPPQDGQYTVAGYLTTYNDLNGYRGARLEWAGNVTGQTAAPAVSYDHSGNLEGAALFLNCPPNTGGQPLYTRDISNLCFGKQLFFECWIAVFTNSASGAYNGVNVKVRLTDNGDATNVKEITATANRQADGGGVWVRVAEQINLVGTSLKMEIINNQNVSVNGNDLVVDDIKIMACAPPPLEVFFDLATLAKTKEICTTDFDVITKPSDLLKKYYNNAPSYLYQWTRTPTVTASWKNLGTPQTGESYNVTDPKTTFSVNDGDKVYFRVIAATPAIYAAKNNFQGAGNEANINDPCKNYSVSTPIEATVKCPACSQPTSVDVKNGAAIIPSKGKYIVCEGSAVNLTVDAAWPAVLVADKKVEVYYKKPNGTETILATIADGGASTTSTGSAFTIAAITAADSGKYIFGVRNTASCKLEDTIRISFFKKILDNVIEANDTICVNGKPLGFKQKSGTTTSGDFTGYKWQSGTSATGAFTDIASTNSEAYKPTAPNVNTAGTYYYRRVALAKKDGTAVVCADSISKTVVLVVQPAITANTISLANNPVCSGREASFTGSAVAGGAYGWLQGTNSTGPWTMVANASQQDLKVTVNKIVSATYYFRRIVKLGKCADTTAPTKVDVIDGMNPGAISKDQTICLGNNAAMFTSTTAASGGTGTGGPTYMWQTATSTSGPWTNIATETNTTFSPPTPTVAGVTYYRRRATNGNSPCDTAYTNTVKLTVATPPIAEIVQPVSVLSSDIPPSKSTTTRNPSIFVQAKDPSAAYIGEWSITNGRGTSLKGGNMKALSDSLLLKNFGETTTAVWTVQDTAKACTPVTATVVVTRKNFTLPDAGPDDTICISNVGTYKLKGNAFTAGDEVGTWELVNPVAGLSITQNPADATEASITVPGAGVYEFRYRIVNSVLNENNVDIVKITVDAEVVQPTLPRAEVSICVREFQLEAGYAKPFPTAVGTWKAATGQVFTTQVFDNPNDSNTFIRVLPLGIDTKLTWEVKNGVCPPKAVDFTIHQVGELSNPTISLNGTLIRGSDTTLCFGNTYSLTSNIPVGTESGEWTAIPGGSSISMSPGGTNPVQSVNTIAEGNTDVTWTMKKNSCPDAPRKVTLKVYKVPTLAQLVGSPICEDQDATYFAKSVIPATNDTLPITGYNWFSLPNTPAGSKGIATIQGANNTATGVYKFSSTATTGATDQATIVVNATNDCGTSADVGAIVTINLRPRDFNNQISGLSPICESSSLDQSYSIPAQTNTTLHNWTLDGIPLAVSPQPALDVTIPIADIVSTTTAKELVVQLENACGKGVSDTFEIQIIPAIPVVAKLSGYDTVCLPRDGFTYTASSPNAGTNPTYLFTITHPDGSAGKTQGPGTVNTFPTAVGDLKDGSTIRVEIIGDPLTGCFTAGSGTDERIIDGYEYPDTTISFHSNDTVCFGNKVIFSIDNTKKGNVLYTWYKDNNSSPVKSSTESYIELANRSESGLYKVKIDNLVCDSRTSGEHRARIFDQPKVNFNPNEVLMEIAVTPTLTLAPEITGLTGDPLTQVAWSPTELLTISDPLATTATFTPPPTGGQFVYSIYVATGEGRVFCPADASIKIFALPPVRVPNAFSPNNDGLNELWQIDGIEAYPRARVIVYNRWGNKMHDVSPYNGQNGWDGTNNGMKLPMGTYYYVIDLNENTVVQSRYLTGSLTIVH